MAIVLHGLRGAERARGAVGHAVRLLRALLVVATIGLMQCSSTPDGPLVVGVLLPMSGPTSFDSLTGRRALELAQANLAAGGAVGGRAIELRFVDIAQVDPAVAAKAMADDGDVVAVIGPDTSTAAFAVGPIFDAAKKPLVVPSASSADFGRAFAGRRTMWRTIESDIAQTRVLLELAAKNGAHKVALLTSFEPYGETFFDWFAFYATELGLEVTASERTALSASSCADDVRKVAATSPDAMLIVPSTPAGLTCTALAHADLAVRPRLYYPDIGRDPALIAALGARAEGIEGTAPAASSDSGFLEAWRARYAEELPPTYAASTYDALLLLGYGLTSSGGRGGQALIDALERVVTARGETVRSDAAGVARALELLRNNASPNVQGASSRLDYDSVGFTDLTSSTYGLWRVEGQAFIRTAAVDTGGDGPGSERAVFATVGSNAAQQQLADNPSLVVGPKKGLWALIVAASVGWPNYRHQADALAQYQLLRANGVADDHIVLVAQDDLATAPANAIKGTVRNVAGGPNVREPAVIDYRVGDLAASDLSDILLGRARADLPTVLQSGPDDDVYVFLVGHGNGSGLYLRADSPSFVATPRDLFAPSMLGLAIRTLAQRAAYRRMLIAVEMCNGGVMGAALGDDTPRAALLSGAMPFEESFAANYDFALKQWVADQFAFALWDVSSNMPETDLRRAFGALYARVPGSHVRMYNTENFGALASVALGDFFRP